MPEKPTLKTDRFGVTCLSRSRFRKTSLQVALQANPEARLAARTIAFSCVSDAVVEDTDCLADTTDQIALFATRLPVGSRCTGSQDGENPGECCAESALRVDQGEIRTFAH